MNEVIRDAYTFLQDLYERDKNVIENEELMPIKNSIREINYYSSETPRIMLLGEFKSGKSTLLNALFGQNVAATGILEMTSWVARYWRSEEAFCTISFKDGRIANETPELFYDKCMNRKFSKDELNSIDRVDIGIENVDINFSIIDTPGFGSITYDNENRAMNSIKEADYVFWVLSCETIGNMKEIALIDKIQESGTPLVCILSKYDMLNDEDEYNEIVEYLENNLQKNLSRIFPVSARMYMKNPENPVEKKRFDQLRDFIKNEIVVSQKEIRKKAQESHFKIIADHCVDVMNRIMKDVKLSLAAKDRYASLVDSIKSKINMSIESKLNEHARKTLYIPYRDALIQGINNLGSRISDDNIAQVFNSVLPAQYMDQYMNDFLLYTQTIVNNLWSEGLQEASSEMLKIQSDMRENSVHNTFSFDYEQGQFSSDAKVLADQTIKNGLMTSLGIAGVASIYAAVLGPASASVTIGMAATGIGLPIALIGLGVTMAMSYFTKKDQKTVINGESLLNQAINQFVLNILGGGYINKIKSVNQAYATALVEKYEEKICRHLPVNTLNEMLHILNEKISLLRSFNTGTDKGVSVLMDCPYCGAKVDIKGKICKSCGNYVN